MAQFVAFSPSVQVNGETVLSVVRGLGVFAEKAKVLLEKNGLKDPQAGSWYSQQAWLDTFKEIATLSGPKTLMMIGRKIPESAKFPPEIDCLEKALAAIDVAYHMNHRGGKIGDYGCEQVGPKRIQMLCNNPYPCDFDMGIIEAMATRFKPLGSIIKVQHLPGSCRSKGGNACGYEVTW